MKKSGFVTQTDFDSHIHKDFRVVHHDLWRRVKGMITIPPATSPPTVHDLIGPTHTAAGLTIGHVVRASAADAFAWTQLQHSDLGGVTADLHHPQSHTLVSHTARDHHHLVGLADDDHSQYHNDTRGDTRYYTKSQINTYLEAQDELSEMDDVNISSLAEGHMLQYNASQAEWQNVVNPYSTLAGLTDTNIGTPENGSLLQYWISDSKWHDVVDLPPSAHAASHKSAGSDPIRIDEFKVATDITTLNATTSYHGLLPKLYGGTARFLRADGTWAITPGGTPDAHADSHEVGGDDLVGHDLLTGFLATEHLSLPNSLANVINSGHDKAEHDSLGLDHGALSGKADDDHSQYHNDTRGDVRYYTKSQINTYLEAQDELAEMDDVNITTPAENALLVYVAGEWIDSGIPAHTSSHDHADLANVTSDQHHDELHASTHKSAGGDAIRIDELKVATDITTLNATTTYHGLLPKLYGGTARFLRSDGTWAITPGGTPDAHADSHEVGGSDLVSHDLLTDFAAAEHLSLPNSLTNVINSGHDKATHDALNIDADTVDGEEAAAIVTDARVKAHFPDTIANILSNHTKIVHDSLGIDAKYIDGKEVVAATPTDGYVLTWNNSLSRWEDKTPGTPGVHGSTHEDGGGDEVAHDLLEGYLASEHKSLPRTFADVINAGHTAAIHNSLNIDHGSLGGKGDDDHMQYILASGTRAFTGVVSGITPTINAHLATKGYVDGQVGGVNEFVELTDTPANYTGSAGKFVKVNATPDALVFANLVAGDLPAHASSHEVGGGDLVSHDDLTDFVGAEHLSLPNTIANVLSDHTVAVHNALDITELGTVSSGVWQGTAIANAYIAGIDQNLLTTSSPTHVTAKLTDLTDGYVPYHVTDAAGLANSPIRISGANVGIGVVPGNALHVAGNIQVNTTSQKIHSNIWEVVNSTADMKFRIGSTDAMIIQKVTRNVGIGKTPTERLDVDGKVLSTAFKLGAFELNALIANNKVPDSDKWDGYQFADYLNQAVKTTSSPTHANLTITDFLRAQAIVSTNRNVIGLEYNILFNAPVRFTVSQSGSHPISLPTLFDGKWAPTYSATAPSAGSPQTILIEDLPAAHTQAGVWVGWSTRYWPPDRFKIEGYDIYNSYNDWRVIADYSGVDYVGSDFIVKVPTGGIYTKLRYIITGGTGTDGRFGLSELFFIHPETGKPYIGFLPSSMFEGVSGRVGIGKTDPTEMVDVVGNVKATQFILGSYYLDSSGLVANNQVFNSQKWDGQTIDLTGVTNGQILRYNSTSFNWENEDIPAPTAHATSHHVGGGDLVNHDSLTGFLATEHFLQSAITTVGTIGTGVWQGTAIAWTYVSKTGSNLTDLATRQHAGLSDAPADAHHAQLHASEHHVAGDDLVNHDSLTGFVVAEHVSLPNTIANVLSNHNVEVHDALSIDHGSLFGKGDDDHTQYHTDARGDTRYYTKTQINTYLEAQDELSEMDDVNITSPANNALLVYNSVAGEWQDGGIPTHAHAHGDLTGVTSDQHHPQSHTLVSHTARDHHNLVGLGDDDHTQYYNSTRHTKAVHDSLDIDARYIDGTEVVAATPTDGHVLTYVSANTRWEDKAPAAHSHAHGDLTGVTDDQHHNKIHAASHKSAGGDAIRIDELKVATDITTLNATTTYHGLLPKLYGGTARFLRSDGTWQITPGGTPDAHADSHEVGGSDLVSHDLLTDFVGAEHVSLPNTIANVLSDHTKAVHDSLGLDHGSLSGKADDDHSQYYNSARHTKAIHDALGIIASEAYALDIEDTRAAQRLPNEMPARQVTAEFTDELPGLGAWYSLINVKGWDNGYASWQLIGGSTTSAHENLYFRSGINTTWNTLRKIWHEGSDGSGSGLDADKLEGQHGSYYATSGGAEHDGFSDFVANEHINHTGVSMIAGSGLSGGGTIVANRTFNLGVLTSAWDAGSYQIRALKFYSDQATGTAPFTVLSTTKVTNLNAERVDDLHASSFIRADADDYVSGHTNWQDTKEARFGDAADFRIRHDGSNSYMRSYKHGANVYIQAENAGGTNYTLLTLDPDVLGIIVRDHGAAATDMVVNVCYGVGAPPVANTTTIGTLFVKYTA